MLGVSMSRRCPDQTVSDAARRAQVAADLYVAPPPPSAPKAKTNVIKQANAQRRGGAADRTWGR